MLEIDNPTMLHNLAKSLNDFAAQGNLSKASKTFSCIQKHPSFADSHQLILHSFASLIECCNRFRFLTQGRQLHALIVCFGFYQNPVVVPKLIAFYGSFNHLTHAHILTQSSNSSRPLPWNLLISCYVRRGYFEEAILAYKQMVSKSIRPDNFTYPSVLKACAETNDLYFGKEVHKSIDARANEWNVFVTNALISMYGKFGEVNAARELFDKMLERDTVSWNTIVSVYASLGMWEEAFQMFDQMRAEGIVPNIVTWNTVAGGCIRVGNFKGVLQSILEMIACGIQLDHVAVINGLGACSHIGSIRIGKEIHCFAIRNCCDTPHNVTNALITMYSRCNDLKVAYLLFQLLETKSIITWNCMLSGYVHMGKSEEASFLFRELLVSGMQPNNVTITSILPLCARVANLQHGREYHCYITRRPEFSDKLQIWNALVDMYARSGKVVQAKRVFDSMSKRDVVTYTSLIAGYGMQGEGRVALKIFEEMKRLQIKPDHITMVAVLSACSHSCLVADGQKLFDNMTSEHYIVPHLQHFSCIVDLLGRAGFLHRAQAILKRMPYTPTSAICATLLGACCIHRNYEIGEWAADKLLETRPENSGYYVLIANLYAAAGSWNKLAKVRTHMRDLGVKKDPGCAWVDLGGGFSPFVVGDTVNPQRHEIQLLLDGLTKEMKYIGFVATNNDVSKDDEDVELLALSQ